MIDIASLIPGARLAAAGHALPPVTVKILAACPGSLAAMDPAEEESRVEVAITYDTSAAPHKADEPYLYVMFDALKPDAGKLYFTQAEWDAFVLGVKDGEFDLDEDGNLPPVPEDREAR